VLGGEVGQRGQDPARVAAGVGHVDLAHPAGVRAEMPAQQGMPVRRDRDEDRVAAGHPVPHETADAGQVLVGSGVEQGEVREVRPRCPLGIAHNITPGHDTARPAIVQPNKDPTSTRQGPHQNR
jgi:hypothetical protein